MDEAAKPLMEQFNRDARLLYSNFMRLAGSRLPIE